MASDRQPLEPAARAPAERADPGELTPEMIEVLDRWRRSEVRSRARRQDSRSGQRRRRLGVLLAAASLSAAVGGRVVIGDAREPAPAPEPSTRAAVAVATEAPDRGTAPPWPAARLTLVADRSKPRPTAATQRARAAKIPSASALRKAWAYAGERGGAVSIAVVDSEGKLRGRSDHRLFAAASVVKAMLLSAELRRLARADEPLDSSTESLLRAMITYSDNEAADSIYARVGDNGLFEVARLAGMDDFTVAGHWGNAQIAAADMARFFADLDRMFPRGLREEGKGLLGSVVSEQRWGIPAAAGEDWAVRFKGGWLPDHALAHQAAELQEAEGHRELSIAILTDDQPSHGYAVETVRGVAERLLAG